MRVARRIEIRFPVGQALPKLEELTALASPDVRVVERDRRDLVRRLDLELIGRADQVTGFVRVVERHFDAQLMRDEVLAPRGAPKDPPYPDPESTRRISASTAPTAGPEHVPTGTGSSPTPVIVAIIDSGIMAAHPDLERHIWNGPGDPPIHGKSFIDSVPGIDDQDGHGTMLAGTVLAGAERSAVVRLMAIKFFDSRTPPASDQGAKAIRWAVDHGAKILNLSWAVGVVKPGTPEKPGLRDAIEYARKEGVLVVVAAGNSGADNDAYPSFPASYGHPSHGQSMEHVITVMATDDLDDRPGFSNYGAKSVHIAAPGMRITSTHPYRNAAPKPEDWERYQRYDGTSAAAAYVSGAAALLKSVCPQLSPKELKDFLIDSAEPARDPRGGVKPRLNVSQALAAVRAHCHKAAGAAGGLLAPASPGDRPA